MDKKFTEIDKELNDLRIRESEMREKRYVENIRLREKLQEKETQLATMESLSMKVIQCRKPSKYYVIFLKDKWLQL